MLVCNGRPSDQSQCSGRYVEASIKRRGSQFSEHIDYKHGAVINIGPGLPVKWRLKGGDEAVPDREVEAIVKEVDAVVNDAL